MTDDREHIAYEESEEIGRSEGSFFDDPDHHDEHVHDRGPHPRRKRALASCLVVLVVIGVVAAVAVFAVGQGIDRVKDMFAGPEDYSGEGTGQVLFEVHEGDSTTAIGRNLKAKGVVKSVEAFTDQAAEDSAAARGIQVGFYEMRKQMSAESAFDVLVDPDNLVQSAVTVPEGARVRAIVDAIASKTDISRKSVVAALADPKSIGLPASAGGNPEGYLYPATYPVGPKDDAVDLLSAMVAKTESVEKDLDVAAGAKALGLTTEEVFTVASILEYEANRDEDYPKVARVIYNRIDQGMPLQLDSTVSYASGREGDVWTTSEERESDSLYNTYKHQGLPPGPIGSPGEATLDAALHPADGDWLYFVPDFEKGTTLFTDDYQEHLRNVEKAKEYCRTHEEC